LGCQTWWLTVASLRKRPAPEVSVASVEPVKPVTVAIDTEPPPASEKFESVSSPPGISPTESLKAQIAAIQRAEEIQRQQQAIMAAEGRRKEWFGNSPLAQKYYQHLMTFHDEAVHSGLIDTSPQYFEHMERRLADLHAQEPATVGTHLAEEMHHRAAQDGAKQPPPPQPRLRSNIVSAPVSREVPTASGRRFDGKVTLTPIEIEHARAAGVSDVEYARQKLKLQAMKEAGEYRDR
jgi:hypothetical protein